VRAVPLRYNQALILADRFREIGLNAVESGRTPPRHAALRDDPAALALRLFRDGVPLSDSESACLFNSCDVPRLLVESRLRLDFVEDLFLFSDWPSSEPDTVLPPGETAAILYKAAQQFTAYRRVLDLCCGSGTLALLLGRGIGTDLNPHAIELARMNAAINGLADIEFRQGSLFAPVAGEQFDLIVCQPPFVPRPPETSSHLFLHGGLRGDELAREILLDIPRHLSPNGLAMLYSDWPLAEGELLAERIPAEHMHAQLFASPMITRESYCEAYGQELRPHFETMGITGIRQCLTVLTHGHGIDEHEVLPHQWACLGGWIKAAATMPTSASPASVK